MRRLTSTTATCSAFEPSATQNQTRLLVGRHERDLVTRIQARERAWRQHQGGSSGDEGPPIHLRDYEPSDSWGPAAGT